MTLLTSCQLPKGLQEIETFIKSYGELSEKHIPENKKNVILAPFCKSTECEDAIKDRSARAVEDDEPVDERAPSMGAKSLCIPLEQPESESETEARQCVQCSSKAKCWVLWGRSY